VRRIYLISCASKKLSYPAKAKDIYVSPLFRLGYNFAVQSRPDAIYILSAKHGLLDPNTEIEPYNVTLNEMSSNEVRAWSDKVLYQLTQCCDLNRDHFVFLAGSAYRKYLVDGIRSYEVPMEGLAIGKQLQYLSERTR
jgi:hypothetical protein